jgi:hypothetical protein
MAQIKLRWSKKEKDWIFNAPDNSGYTMAGVLFDMLKQQDTELIGGKT